MSEYESSVTKNINIFEETMNFAINIEYLLKTMPLDVAAEKLARAGFKSVKYKLSPVIIII